MPADFLAVVQWLVDAFTSLWTAFGGWAFLGFAIIFFPILRRLIRLFRSLIHTIK